MWAPPHTGADRRARTPDLTITNRLLYQLSYTGIEEREPNSANLMPYTSAFALWTSENWDTCHMTRLTALRLLYSGGSAIRLAGKERRKPACRIIQRSQGYWFVLCLLETLFRSPSSGKVPNGMEAYAGFEPVNPAWRAGVLPLH